MSATIRYGYASVGILPVRREASDTSEMVSQLVLGETARILAETDRWFNVRADHDGYEGWVGRSQFSPMDPADYLAWANHPERKRSIHQHYRVSNGIDGLTVPAGAHVVTTPNGIELPNGGWETIQDRTSMKEHSILDTALNFRGTPYLWGGRTDTGIDCSGFVQLVFELHGYALPRDAWQQHGFAPARQVPISESEAGDLVYFSYDAKGIQHVGFHLGDGLLLHASGTVTIHNIQPTRRGSSRYLYNERLAATLHGVQSTHDVKTAAIRNTPC